MKKSLNSYIDHTLLRPDCTAGDIKKLCQEAIRYEFASVCLPPIWVPFAKLLLQDCQTKIGSVVGFPLGAITSEAKVFESKQLAELGAKELDIVMNITLFKSKKYQGVLKDLSQIVQAVPQVKTKIIVETCLLTEDEKKIAAKICLDSGAHFIKTSTGFAQSGACVDDVKLFHQLIGQSCGIKASGGIHSAQQALSLIEAGATRLGTSKGKTIMEQFLNK
ncbi:MAG: deoxyribose-phosphate aldolase [Parachlamydiaceae bacterium]